MKKIFTLLNAIAFAGLIFAQSPDNFKYQAVIHDNSGNILNDKQVGLRISIIENDISGNSVYTESFQTTTNAFGLVSLEIGNGTKVSGDFATIDWGNGAYFLSVELDFDGTLNYLLMGTTQLLSVPYALFANKAGNGFSGDYNDLSNKPDLLDTVKYLKTETDPVFNTSIAKGINSLDTANWNAKSNFSGNYNDLTNKPDLQDTAKYLEVETDPVFITSIAKGISSTDTATWNAKSNFSGQYIDLESKPTLFDGNWYSLNQRPPITVDTNLLNIFIGYKVGGLITSGADNTFIGDSCGLGNTTGSYNSFYGQLSGRANTSGYANSFFGQASGVFNTTGSCNTFVGEACGVSNTTASHNSFFGQACGQMNTTGERNSFFGEGCGASNTTGQNNSFFGQGSGAHNTIGEANSFFGQCSGLANLTGLQNSFFGEYCGISNTTGSWNTFVGCSAGGYNTTGSANTYIGQSSGLGGTNAGNNVTVGDNAGSNYDGYFNVIIGSRNWVPSVTGTVNSSVLLGRNTGINYSYASEVVAIGTGSGGTGNVQNSVFLGSYAGANCASNYNAMIGDNAGREFVTGTGNAFLGNSTGRRMTNGISNTLVGDCAGMDILGDRNVIIGKWDYNDSGTLKNISGSVFIGSGAGNNETDSNHLYIANSDTPEPLIYGEFDNSRVTINNVLTLTPRSSAPENPVNGMIYIDSTTNHIYCYLNNSWKQLDN
jgi:hypothetical protein